MAPNRPPAVDTHPTLWTREVKRRLSPFTARRGRAGAVTPAGRRCWHWGSDFGSDFGAVLSTLGSAAASAGRTAGRCRGGGPGLSWGSGAPSRPRPRHAPPMGSAATHRTPVAGSYRVSRDTALVVLTLMGGPHHPQNPPGTCTHAWMRLARSFCEGLVPGVPRGLWPPEIIPDMLQGESPRCAVSAARPLRLDPLFQNTRWSPLRSSPSGAQCRTPALLSDGGCRERHQLTGDNLFLA